MVVVCKLNSRWVAETGPPPKTMTQALLSIKIWLRPTGEGAEGVGKIGR